jgi:hypothetical protein
MSYKNDGLLVIANKFGLSSSNAKAELFETYDKLRDITIGGTANMGSGFGPASSFLLNMARLVAPSSFMPVLNASMINNVPGTSYSSAVSGGNAITAGGRSSFGIGGLGAYPGFPSGGAAPLFTGIGNSITSLSNDFTVGGIPTGYAASMVNWAPSAASAATGTFSGFSGWGSNLLLPAAGIISGIGGIMASMGPYMGPAGLGMGLIGNLAQGYGGSVLAGYQNASGTILNNADVTLSNKVRNIETVVKMLDTQGDIVRKMLKEGIDGDSKTIQNL